MNTLPLSAQTTKEPQFPKQGTYAQELTAASISPLSGAGDTPTITPGDPADRVPAGQRDSLNVFGRIEPYPQGLRELVDAVKEERSHHKFDAVKEEQSHHKFGMSTLNYIAACGAFRSREGTNDAALDGDRLHDVMQKAMLDVVCKLRLKELGQDVAVSALTALREVGRSETVGEDEEFYLEYCCREIDKWLPKVQGTNLAMEQRVYIHNPDGTELNFGHYDLLLFLSEEVALLFDYKFGWIPVPPAESNWQGKGYAVGCFQKYPKLKKIGVIFLQPKLHRTTYTHYTRADLYDMWRGVHDVVNRAQDVNTVRKPGDYCDYCANAGACPALLNEANKAVAVYEGLPMPTSFSGLQITTPEEAARALFVLDRLKALLDHANETGGLKDKAKEFARNNGGKLAAPLPDGRVVTVELKSRSAPRSASSPGAIAEVLQGYLRPEEILAACDINITTLEKIFAEALVKERQAESQAVLARGEAEAQKLDCSGDLTGAAQAREQAKRDAKAIRVTKKQALLTLGDMLTAEGLLSRPEGRVEYTKTRVEKPVSITCQPKPLLEDQQSLQTST